MDIYALHGHLAERFETAVEQFGLTLDLLRQLKSGQVKLCDLVVARDGWEVKECADCLTGASGEARSDSGGAEIA